MKNTNNKKTFSTLGFIMSSIGAAVGLGNIWRFPKEMVESGGSSFILIYIIVLILIVFPIVLLEFQYGLFFKKGVVSCFKNAGKKIGSFFGWKQVVVVGIVSVYYLGIVSWVLVGIVHSTIPSFFEKWSENGEDFFDNEILQIKGFSFLTLIAALVLIILVIIVISLGVKKGIEKINLFLVPGLFLLLIGLTIYFLTQKNADLGLKKLFEFKQESFIKPEVWYKASIQAMFSIGIMFGTFIVLTKNSNIKIDKGNDALIIIASDSFIGILSGVLITTAIASGFDGNDAKVTEQLNKFFEDGKSGGSGLIFQELPAVFSKISSIKWLGQLLFIFFMIGLLFAAFSSLIILLEVFTDSIIEHFPFITRTKAIIFWSIFAFSQYILYSWFDQKKIIDLEDKLINQFILFIGLFEVLLFITYDGFKKIIKRNEKYTYLKMSPKNWLQNMLGFISLPLIVVLTSYGFYELYWKFSHDIHQEKIIVIIIAIFVIIIPFFLTMINKKKSIYKK